MAASTTCCSPRWALPSGTGADGRATVRPPDYCSISKGTAVRRPAPILTWSHTVGWFTSLFPVHLDLSGFDLDDALAGGRALGRASEERQGAAPGDPIQRSRLRALALPERADRRSARRVGAPSARLQLSRPLRCSSRSRLVSRQRRHDARRRRSIPAACALPGGQRLHPRWSGGAEPHSHMDLGLGSLERASRRRTGEGMVRGPGDLEHAAGNSKTCRAARPPTCRWSRRARPRSRSSKPGIPSSRTCCPCRRCRKASWSMRSTMRKDPTSARCRWRLISKGASMPRS